MKKGGLKDEEEYIPGEKNIGPAERRKRYMAGIAGFILATVYLIVFQLLDFPTWSIFFTALPFFVGYIGIIQGKESFCAMFALREIYDVSRGGGSRGVVKSESDHQKDLKKAWRIHIYSIVLAVFSTLIVYIGLVIL